MKGLTCRYGGQAFLAVWPAWMVGVTWVRCGCRSEIGLLAGSSGRDLRLCGLLAFRWGRSTCFRFRRSGGAGFGTAVGPVLAGAGFDLLPGAACGVEHQLGGSVGATTLDLRQDAGVGVGGDHDAGVPEEILQGLQVGSGFVGEGRGAVAQVVQPHRGQPGPAYEDPKADSGVVRIDRIAV